MVRNCSPVVLAFQLSKEIFRRLPSLFPQTLMLPLGFVPTGLALGFFLTRFFSHPEKIMTHDGTATTAFGPPLHSNEVLHDSASS